MYKTLLDQLLNDPQYQKLLSVAPSKEEKDIIEKTVKEFAEQMDKVVLDPLKNIIKDEKKRKELKLELLKKLNAVK